MKTPLAILATSFLAVGAVAFTQDAVTFSRTFAKGSTDKYTVSMKMNTVTDLSAFGQPNMELLMDVTNIAEYTYKDVDEKGTATLDILYKDMKVKVEGPMADMMGGAPEVPSTMKGTAKMDKHGVMSEVKMAQDAASNPMMAMMGGQQSMDSLSMFALPKEGVKVGEEFKVEFPKMPMFKSADMKAKIIGSEVYSEKEAWKLTYDGTLMMDMDLSEMMKDAPDTGMPQMNMRMEGTTKMVMTVLIEKANGRVLSIESVSNSDAKVNMVDMGMSLPVKTDVITSFKLVK